MIYTLTLNPCLDYFLSIEDLKLGKLNLSKENYIIASGKGLNVSKILNNLNVQSIALGFIGGFTGDFILQDLDNLGIKNNFLQIQDNNRINIKIKDLSDNNETEITGQSPNIDENKFTQLLDLIKKSLNSEDILVCTGSIPDSLPSNAYKIISEKLKYIKVVLDTRGNLLNENIHNNLLIKPNIIELEEMFDKKFKDIEEIAEVCQYFLAKQVENIIVSMGNKGSILISKNKCMQAIPINIDICSTIGAGDSMVAGFLSSYYHNKSLEDCYKLAVATATAMITTKEYPKEDLIHKFLDQIKIITF